MASEVALCSFGTRLDSWHGEDDLWRARRVIDGWEGVTLIKSVL